jgi:hypothetical protein
MIFCAADLLHWTPERVCREARAPLLLAPSIKAALDRDWRHVATDLDSRLVLSGAITPANRPEEEAAHGLAEG